MDKMGEREQRIIRHISIISTTESLFTLEADERSALQRVLLEVLDFLLSESTAKGHSLAVLVEIYEMLLQADQRLKFSMLFESNALSVVIHYNLGACFHQMGQIKPAIAYLSDAIMDYELFLKAFCRTADSADFVLLKKRFVCVYLQTAALFSCAKNNARALKIVLSAMTQLTCCLKDFKSFAVRYRLSHYEPIVDELIETVEEALKPPGPEETVRKNVKKAQCKALIHSPETNRKAFANVLENSRNSDFKLSSHWLEYFSIQNVTSGAFIPLSLLEATQPTASQMNDLLIELVLYASISYFALATEKRQIGISECQYSDHKIEDGYGKKFLKALQNEKALLLNSNYLER